MAPGVVGKGQDDICTVNRPQFGEKGARAVAKSGLFLPLLEGLPKRVGQEADEDVGVDAIWLLVPDGTDG